MPVAKLTSVQDLFPQPDYQVLYPDLITPRGFQKKLRSERARSDRTGQGFSLIAFQFNRLSQARSFSNVLRRAAHRRLRPADVPGWLDRHRIGVILPNTKADGALTLAEDILKMSMLLAPPEYQIFLYPAYQGELEPVDVSRTGRRPFFASMETLFGEEMPLWKRMTDIIGALAGLILCAPLFLAISLFVKCVSPGPVLFKQKRVGFLGKPFMCLKFRTMKMESDPSVHQKYVDRLIQDGCTMEKLDNRDERIIPYGQILRKTGLDELPQLINILKGEMSIVGPRPECYDILNSYRQWCTRRFDVTPGLTGLWQVSGKNLTSYNEMMRLDIGYIMKRSLWMDIKILLRTIPAIIGQIRGTL